MSGAVLTIAKAGGGRRGVRQRHLDVGVRPALDLRDMPLAHHIGDIERAELPHVLAEDAQRDTVRTTRDDGRQRWSRTGTGAGITEPDVSDSPGSGLRMNDVTPGVNVLSGFSSAISRPSNGTSSATPAGMVIS